MLVGLRRNRSEIWRGSGDSGRLGPWRMLPNLKNGVSYGTKETNNDESEDGNRGVQQARRC